MTQSQFDEFLTTDSIKRKAELRKMLEDAIEEYLRLGHDDDNFAWYFPDAEENEVGTFEKFYNPKEREVCIELQYGDGTITNYFYSMDEILTEVQEVEG
jgi:hypothetical protein